MVLNRYYFVIEPEVSRVKKFKFYSEPKLCQVSLGKMLVPLSEYHQASTFPTK